MARALVLGVGNILVQDEGVGVRTVEWLQTHYAFPGDDKGGQAVGLPTPDNEVTLLDGGTMGLNLLHYLIGINHLLILDAVEANQLPGTIIELRDEAVPVFLGMKVSPHQVGIQEVLATAQLLGYIPSEVVILGVQPGWLRVGLDLSPAVAAQVEPLARRTISQLEKWGYQGEPIEAAMAFPLSVHA